MLQSSKGSIIEVKNDEIWTSQGQVKTRIFKCFS